jgi:4-amino-4-deoxy-L-arabinose transferase-like glycosyltransferase
VSTAVPARAAARTWPAWLPLAALIVLATILRFATLSAQSLWFDEAATWELARLPFGDMIGALPHRESNPPLYYVLEWLTTRALGDSEFALRALSALFGTLLVPIAYGIGRRVGGARVALATAALVAVNPLLVWYSQEARNYELVALLCAGSLLLLLRTLDDSHPRIVAWWTLVSALALCTHYFACFVLAPQAIWLLWRHPQRRLAIAACGGLAVVFAALLPLLLAQRGNPYDIADASLALRLAQVPKQFVLGYDGPLPLEFGLLGAAIVVLAAWMLWFRVPGATRLRGLLLAAIGVSAVVVPLLAALLGADYLNARNLLGGLVPLASALAAGLVGVAPRQRGAAVGVAALALLCASSLAIVIAVAADPAYQRTDWRGVARALGSSSDARALVISPANGFDALRYYRRDLSQLPYTGSGTPLREVDVIGVAGTTGAGGGERLPQQVGTAFEVPGFSGPQRDENSRWIVLRYRSPTPVPVLPIRVASIRFSQDPPTVALLPPRR